ncbi:MAG: serine protease [Armatimonadota bacterium]
MEVVYGLKGPNLDLILHSPGGSLEAAEGFVEYLRSKFDHIRVIVPQMAMSAGTMVACSADEIVLGKHSCLGPIDPQVMLQTDLGLRMVPAQAILEQFARAQRECKDPTKLASWLPMLKQYGPDLLVQCEHASTLSVELVRGWLQTCMFRDDTEAQQKAKRISAWLGDHSLFKTHGRHITRKALREQGMNVVNLEDDQKLQDEVLSIFHATTHTFNGTGAFKIVENQLGRAFVGLAQLVVPQNAPSPQPGPSTPTK